MFETLRWLKDRALIGDLVFRLEPKTDDWELGDECFRLYKSKYYIDAYARWLPRMRFNNVFELGIFDGGSLALWNECLAPRKLVAVDLSERGDSDYFRRFIEAKGLQDRVKTYWGVDQADTTTLRKIVEREFDSPLDLVIDDACHFYGPTKTSFETLFPFLREGAVYVIEDWPWEYLEDQDTREYFGNETQTLTELVMELTKSIHSRTIASLIVTEEFVMAERGPLPADRVNDFRIVVPTRASPEGNRPK